MTEGFYLLLVLKRNKNNAQIKKAIVRNRNLNERKIKRIAECITLTVEGSAEKRI